MKNFKVSVIWALLALLIVPGLASCGSDNDGADGGTTFPANPPRYESASGKYEISDPSSPYESVELGASGDYVVTKRGYASHMASLKKAQLFFGKKSPATRATTNENIIYGTYTQLDDNTFQLKGFGTIKLVTNSSQSVTSISIKPDNGTEMTYTASKAPSVGEDDLTDALCRTWKVVRTHEKGHDPYAQYEDEVDYDYTYTPNEDPEALTEVMFTKSGTFVNVYRDNIIETIFWKWEDQNQRVIRGSWDNVWYNDDEETVFTVSFLPGNRMTIHEYYADNETGEWYDITVELVEKNPSSGDDQPVIDLPESESPVARVFTGKLVDVVDDHGTDKFIYENGFLTQVVYAGDSYESPYTIDFEYFYLNPNKSASDPDVRYTMTSEDGSYVYDVWLNEAGFAREIKSIHYERNGDVSFDFETTCRYDGEGHLIYMNEGREEREYNLTWTAGDLVSIETVGRHVTNFSYSEATNDNNLMFFYDVYDMDIEELKYLYWAGLLGVAPVHQIIHSEEVGYAEGSYDYKWEPNRLLSKYSDEDESKWEETTTFTFQE